MELEEIKTDIKKKRNWKKLILLILGIPLMIVLSFFLVTGVLYITGEYNSPTPANAPTYFTDPLNPNNNSVGFTNGSYAEVANIDKDSGNIYSRGNLTANYSTGGYGYFQYVGDVLSPITKIFAINANIRDNVNATNFTAKQEVYINNLAVSPYLYNSTGTGNYYYNQTTGTNSQYGQWWYNQTAPALTIINTNMTNLNASLYMWLYNQTTASNLSIVNAYGKWFYNMSDGSYNSTYDKWAYNETIAGYTNFYNRTATIDKRYYNTTQNNGTYNFYGDGNQAYTYYNGSTLIIKVN